MPKVSIQVHILDRKIWKLFRPHGNGRKRTKYDQFFCPTSDFFDFCNPWPCFFYHTCTFTNDVDFVDKAYAEICDHSPGTTVCLQCSLARLKNKHIGVLGIKVATTSWLHWSRGPVSVGICSAKFSNWIENLENNHWNNHVVYQQPNAIQSYGSFSDFWSFDTL